MIYDNHRENSSHKDTIALIFLKIRFGFTVALLLAVYVMAPQNGLAKHEPICNEAPPVPTYVWNLKLPHSIPHGTLIIHEHPELFMHCPEASVEAWLDASGEYLNISLENCSSIPSDEKADLATISVFNASEKVVYHLRASGGAVIIVLVDD